MNSLNAEVNQTIRDAAAEQAGRALHDAAEFNRAQFELRDWFSREHTITFACHGGYWHARKKGLRFTKSWTSFALMLIDLFAFVHQPGSAEMTPP